MPPSISLEQVTGFGIFMVKADPEWPGRRDHRSRQDQPVPLGEGVKASAARGKPSNGGPQALDCSQKLGQDRRTMRLACAGTGSGQSISTVMEKVRAARAALPRGSTGWIIPCGTAALSFASPYGGGFVRMTTLRIGRKAVGGGA
jgi:hypothetical protein